MKPDKLLRNVLVGIVYLATMFLWLPLLPFIAAVFVWRNWFGWAVALDRLPGIAGGGGARSGAVAFVYVFVLLAVLGSAFGSAAPDEAVPSPVGGPSSDPGDTTPQPESNLITKSEAAMLPTLDDFDAGWIQTAGQHANETQFYNVDTDTAIKFRVTKFDSVETAVTAHAAHRQDIRQRGLSTEAVNVGDDGFLYKYDRAYIVVTFRVQNVVAGVGYDGPRVATPELNSVRYARLLEDKITD